MQPNVEVVLADERCYPKRANPSDAGADLVSIKDMEIYPGEKYMVDTGVAIRIPVGYVGLVFNRSSQGKLRVVLTNGTGVIDADYRGNIKVILANDGVDPYKITAFDTRIAQLTIVPVMLANFTEFKGANDEWLNTTRGIGGFGSTGV